MLVSIYSLVTNHIFITYGFCLSVINIWSLNQKTIQVMSDPFYLDQCTALVIPFPLPATPSWRILGKD